MNINANGDQHIDCTLTEETEIQAAVEKIRIGPDGTTEIDRLTEIYRQRLVFDVLWNASPTIYSAKASKGHPQKEECSLSGDKGMTTSKKCECVDISKKRDENGLILHDQRRDESSVELNKGNDWEHLRYPRDTMTAGTSAKLYTRIPNIVGHNSMVPFNRFVNEVSAEAERIERRFKGRKAADNPDIYSAAYQKVKLDWMDRSIWWGAWQTLPGKAWEPGILLEGQESSERSIQQEIGEELFSSRSASSGLMARSSCSSYDPRLSEERPTGVDLSRILGCDNRRYGFQTSPSTWSMDKHHLLENKEGPSQTLENNSWFGYSQSTRSAPMPTMIKTSEANSAATPNSNISRGSVMEGFADPLVVSSHSTPRRLPSRSPDEQLTQHKSQQPTHSIQATRGRHKWKMSWEKVKWPSGVLK
jgi:hypothetical protein